MIYPPQSLRIQSKQQTDDDIGGFTTAWKDVFTVKGYIDMLTGDDTPLEETNAFIERSTHICIIPKYTAGITDDMRVVDEADRWYEITYSDDPVGVHHHNELYIKLGGELNGGNQV
jgi:SPP1 family predicted phage head-tail adaptor